MLRIFAIVSLATATAVCLGCSNSGSSGSKHGSPPDAKVAAVRKALRLAVALDQDSPNAHRVSFSGESNGGPDPTNAFSSLSQGWLLRISIPRPCPEATPKGATCGSPLGIFYVWVRDRHARVIYRSKGPNDWSDSAFGRVIADCRRFPCEPEPGVTTCATCAAPAGVPLTITGNGWTFRLKQARGGFDLYLPPGRYTVTAGDLHGMHAPSGTLQVPKINEAPPRDILLLRYR